MSIGNWGIFSIGSCVALCELKKQTNNQCVVAPAAEIRIRGSDLVTLIHRCCGCSPNIIILALKATHTCFSSQHQMSLTVCRSAKITHPVCTSCHMFYFSECVKFFFYLIEFKELVKSLSELNLHLKESCDTFCVSFFSFYSFFINK